MVYVPPGVISAASCELSSRYGDGAIMDGWYGFPQDCARKQGVERSIFVVWHASSSRGFDDDGAMSTRCFSFRCNLADQLQAESSMRSRTMARIMLEQQQQHQPLFDSSHFELVTKCVMICHNTSRCDQTWHSNPQPSRPVCHPHHLTLLGRSNNRRWFEMGVVYSTCRSTRNHRSSQIHGSLDTHAGPGLQEAPLT